MLRTLKNRNVYDYLISANDIPIDDPEVRSAFFTEVGQREPFQAVLEADFIGPNATVKRIDKVFTEKRNPATQIATSILMFSFGGQPKEEGKEGEILPPGVKERDLMIATLSPSLPFEFVYKTEKEQEKIGIKFLTQYGEKPRVYKNGIALAIPDKNQIEPLRRAIRYLMAIERVRGRKNSLDLIFGIIFYLKLEIL